MAERSTGPQTENNADSSIAVAGDASKPNDVRATEENLSTLPPVGVSQPDDNARNPAQLPKPSNEVKAAEEMAGGNKQEGKVKPAAENRRLSQLSLPAEQLAESEAVTPPRVVGKAGKEATSTSGTPNGANSPSTASCHSGDHMHDFHHFFDHGPVYTKHSHWTKIRESVHGIAAFKQAARRGNRRKLVLRMVLVVVLGCVAVIPYEFLLKADTQATRMTNMALYVYAMVSSLFTGGTTLLTARKIPLTTMAGIVIAFYGFNQLSAVAFAMGLSLPLALVIKNGGILSQMIAGSLVAGSKYSKQQFALACLATAGIIITVLSSTNPRSSASGGGSDESSWWLLGAVMMFLAMMSRALATVWIQQAYLAHGRHYDEVLFYQHALGIPLLLWETPALKQQLQAWSASPHLFIHLAVLVFANFAVTKACQQLVGISSPVVLNVVLVLQRFISILASALYFNAPPYPPAMMWVGSVLVVLGCVGYVLAPAAKTDKTADGKSPGKIGAAAVTDLGSKPKTA